MKKIIILIISLGSTLLICGFSLSNLLLAALSLIVVFWVEFLLGASLETEHIISDPDKSNSGLIAEALGRCLRTASGSNRKLRLIILNRGRNPLKIDVANSGELKISDSHRNIPIQNSALWIPDHPLPLNLDAGCFHQLYFKPSEKGRIHVSTGTALISGSIPPLLFPLIVLLIVLNFNSAAAAITAALLNHMLSRHFN